MPNFNFPITEIIQKRFSCRDYSREPVNADKREKLQAFIGALPPAPFGSTPRFDLLAASEGDGKSLRGLGTYGFIKNPSGFILGAMPSTARDYDLEDYGYLMEMIILYATSLELGTCWLGGTFTKSKFAEKINLAVNETMPAITAMGEYRDADQKRRGWTSKAAGSAHRLPWDNLFFNIMLDTPLIRNEAGKYATALEMVRIAPSASNKQPWRILKYKSFWRFYLRRTPGYREDIVKRILKLSDLQRLDMGIAMCHFESTAKELGLKGKWVAEKDLDKNPAVLTEYILSWKSQDD